MKDAAENGIQCKKLPFTPQQHCGLAPRATADSGNPCIIWCLFFFKIQFSCIYLCIERNCFSNIFFYKKMGINVHEQSSCSITVGVTTLQGCSMKLEGTVDIYNISGKFNSINAYISPRSPHKSVHSQKEPYSQYRVEKHSRMSLDLHSQLKVHITFHCRSALIRATQHNSLGSLRTLKAFSWMWHAFKFSTSFPSNGIAYIDELWRTH